MNIGGENSIAASQRLNSNVSPNLAISRFRLKSRPMSCSDQWLSDRHGQRPRRHGRCMAWASSWERRGRGMRRCSRNMPSFKSRRIMIRTFNSSATIRLWRPATGQRGQPTVDVLNVANEPRKLQQYQPALKRSSAPSNRMQATELPLISQAAKR